MAREEYRSSAGPNVTWDLPISSARGKNTVTLDLKSARARAIFLAMAAKADGSTDEVTRWPQRIEREMIVKLLNPLTGTTAAAPAPGFAIKFGRTPASYDRPASVPGAHSEEILARFANLSAHKRSN